MNKFLSSLLISLSLFSGSFAADATDQFAVADFVVPRNYTTQQIDLFFTQVDINFFQTEITKLQAQLKEAQEKMQLAQKQVTFSEKNTPVKRLFTLNDDVLPPLTEHNHIISHHQKILSIHKNNVIELQQRLINAQRSLIGCYKRQNQLIIEK